jgi:hypothetical protein
MTIRAPVFCSAPAERSGDGALEVRAHPTPGFNNHPWLRPAKASDNIGFT